MEPNFFKSLVIAVLPGDVTVTAVVRDAIEEQDVALHQPSNIPYSAYPLVLAQVLSAILPNGVAKFHAWKCLNAIQADLEGIHDQMANVPAVSEDELPF